MFLIKVYKQWKAFFWGIIIALVAQFFFMAKAIENIPFFLYHMYGYAHMPKDSINVILVKTPDGYMNPFELSGRESEMLMNNILYYTKMKRNNWNDYLIPTVEKRFLNRMPANTFRFLQQGLINDSIDFSRYTDWWVRYLKTVSKKSYDSVTVVSGYIKYNPVLSKTPFDSIIFTAHLK